MYFLNALYKYLLWFCIPFILTPCNILESLNWKFSTRYEDFSKQHEYKLEDFSYFFIVGTRWVLHVFLTRIRLEWSDHNNVLDCLHLDVALTASNQKGNGRCTVNVACVLSNTRGQNNHSSSSLPRSIGPVLMTKVQECLSHHLSKNQLTYSSHSHRGPGKHGAGMHPHSLFISLSGVNHECLMKLTQSQCKQNCEEKH